MLLYNIKYLGDFIMDKKIYVVGIEESMESNINSAVCAIAGVSNCVANTMKCQVLVSFDESVAGIEEAIDSAISSCGVDIL
jgi:hypothetical protein